MNLQKSKRSLIFIAIIFLIATFADLKYKGKGYQLLPRSIQTCVDELLES